MKIEQSVWKEDAGCLSPVPAGGLKRDAQLVFVFGTTAILEDIKRFQEIKELYPEAHIFGCSTAGEICGARVHDKITAYL
ncbi:MAG: hypothetical protein NT010_00450 [Proteobacteria bacterium]|nr:hypothetical protein [Pseudomonadota bacterium]